MSLKETEKEWWELLKKDESYFGAKRVRGKREEEQLEKKWVFGLLKRDEKLFT